MTAVVAASRRGVSRRVAFVLTLSLVSGSLVSGSFAAASILGRSDVRNPADVLLDRARDAVNRHEFRASVSLWWRDADGGHREIVDVVAVGGGLRLADGRVLEAGRRAWMRADQGWTTLWADARDPRAPRMNDKYAVAIRSGPSIIGRATRELVVRSHGRVVERMAFDREFGLVLRSDRLGAEGALIARAEFVALTDVRDRDGDLEAPEVGDDAPRAMRKIPSDVPRSLGDGFGFVDSRRLAHETLARYSDGVFELSVFTRAGALDWESLPDGGRNIRYGSVLARRYRTASGTVIVWQSRGRVLTCVTDATVLDQAGIVEDLARDDDSAWSGAVRFVTSPFQWN